MSVSRDAFIIGATWTFTQAGFWQDLELIDSANVFQHTLGEYFVLDSDTLNSSKVVWY